MKIISAAKKVSMGQYNFLVIFEILLTVCMYESVFVCVCAWM